MARLDGLPKLNKHFHQHRYQNQRRKRLGKANHLIWLWVGVMVFGLVVFSQSHLLGIWTKANAPQAILVLGGAPAREKFAAVFANQHPKLPVFVSSGSPEEYAHYVFDQAGVPRQRIHLNYKAVDTVTNFTTMLPELESRQVKDVYVITSDFHMPRACLIGQIIFGSRGIRVHPVSIPSNQPAEPTTKYLRDGFRSVWWAVTGNSLES